MSPLKKSNNIAARMGRWSASHWKTAVFGWLAFVVVAVVIGMQVGTKQIDNADTNVGQAHKADQILAAGRLRQADLQTEYRPRPDEDAHRVRPGVPRGRRTTRSRRPSPRPRPRTSARRSTRRNADQISADGHTAYVEFDIEGRPDRSPRRTSTRSPPATRQGAAGQPRLLRSARPARQLRQGARRRCSTSSSTQAGERSVPLTLLDPARRVRRARRGGDAAAARALGRAGHARPARRSRATSSRWTRTSPRSCCSSGSPSASTTRSSTSSASARSGRPAGAPGGARGRSGHVRPVGADLRPHGDDRDGRDVLLRRQDVHVVRRSRRCWSSRSRCSARSPCCRRSCRSSATGSRRAASRSSAASAASGETSGLEGRPHAGARAPGRAAAAASAASSSRWRCRRFTSTPRQSGLDALPQSVADGEGARRLPAPFPGGAAAGDRRREGQDRRRSGRPAAGSSSCSRRRTPRRRCTTHRCSRSAPTAPSPRSRSRSTATAPTRRRPPRSARCGTTSSRRRSAPSPAPRWPSRARPRRPPTRTA